MSKKAKWMADLYEVGADLGAGDGEIDTAYSGKSTPYVAPAPAAAYKRCYETHPPLIITPEVKIFGGSCSQPVVSDADIYVGLDLSMQKSIKAYPWEEGESFLYHIADMTAPADPESFAKMIDWLAVQLAAQKKIHVGCIGGHGRTGTVLAALVNAMTGNKDAVQYVRDNYCKKAVESQAQIDFLHKYFGITKVEPTKGNYGNYPSTGNSYSSYSGKHTTGSVSTLKHDSGWTKANPPKKGAYELKKPKDSKEPQAGLNTYTVKPCKSISCLFGENVKVDSAPVDKPALN